MKKKATIKIEVLEDVEKISFIANLHGETRAIMIGLTNAIKEVESKVPKKDRADYRAHILEMLNDRY